MSPCKETSFWNNYSGSSKLQHVLNSFHWEQNSIFFHFLNLLIAFWDKQTSHWCSKNKLKQRTTLERDLLLTSSLVCVSILYHQNTKDMSAILFLLLLLFLNCISNGWKWTSHVTFLFSLVWHPCFVFLRQSEVKSFPISHHNVYQTLCTVHITHLSYWL